MNATCLMPTMGETRSFYISSQDCVPEPAIPTRPILLSLPKAKLPRSARGNYTSSELSSAAKMLNFMRQKKDVNSGLSSDAVPQPLGSDQVLNVVIDKLLEQFDHE